MAYWRRDAANAERSQAVVLIGLRADDRDGSVKHAEYDCNACGYPTCAEFRAAYRATEKEFGYKGPSCALRLIDVGVAIGSAAKTAGLQNVDHRVQQRIAAAARQLGLIQADVVLAVSLSSTGKNIFFDRRAASRPR